MDFDILDLREAGSREYWVQLRHGGTLLFADMDKQERPCRVKVASIAEHEVEQAVKAVMRVGGMVGNLEAQLVAAPNKQQRTQLEKRLEEIEREAERCITAFIVKAVRDWENIEKGGKVLPFSTAALEDMAQPKAPLFQLAIAIAEDAGRAQNPFPDAVLA